MAILLSFRGERKKSETRMASSVLNQDPNTSKVQKNGIVFGYHFVESNHPVHSTTTTKGGGGREELSGLLPGLSNIYFELGSQIKLSVYLARCGLMS